MSDLSTLKQIHESLLLAWRSSRTVVSAPPFEGYLDDDSSVPWMSIALPFVVPRSEEEISIAVSILRAAFRKKNRVLRFELFTELWPGVTGALEKAGFKKEEPQPILICSDGLVDVEPAPVDIMDLPPGTSLDTFVSFVYVQRRAYGFSGTAVGVGEEALSISRDVERGRLIAVVAVHDEEIVGTALAVGVGRIREIAGVCTIPEMRKRGVASALCSSLTSRHFQTGGELAWLTAGSPEAERIYRRLGFERTGASQINVSDPGSALH